MTHALRDDIRDAELVLIVFRTLLLMVLALAPRVLDVQEAVDPRAIGMMVVAGVYNIVMAMACLAPGRFGVRRSLVLAMDTTLITAWIAFSGRWELIPFYYVVVVVAAMWGRVFGGVMAAAVCNFLFLFLWARVAGNTDAARPPAFTTAMAINSVLLFVVGTLAGFISEAQEREREQRLERELLIANYQSEIDLSGELQPLLVNRVSGGNSDFDIGAALQSARTVGGGDYLDAIALPDGRTLLCIGDVAGKSVRAQARVPLLKYSLRALAPLHPDPAELMERLQTTLAPDLAPELYIALCLVVIDDQTHVLQWCNAGHIAPILARFPDAKSIIDEAKPRLNGEITRLETTCPALGLFPEIAPVERSVKWNRGDALLLFTDGLSDALSFGGQADGEEQVEKLAARLGNTSSTAGEAAQELVDLAGAALDDKPFVARHFTLGEEVEKGTSRRDDVAVLVVKWTPVATN